LAIGLMLLPAPRSVPPGPQLLHLPASLLGLLSLATDTGLNLGANALLKRQTNLPPNEGTLRRQRANLPPPRPRTAGRGPVPDGGEMARIIDRGCDPLSRVEDEECPTWYR
jgi:hypothetical protein